MNQIHQLQEVEEIIRIVISSDSTMMLTIAKCTGSNTHKRAPKYCDEKTKSLGDVVRHITENVDGENILWATCTSTVIISKDYRWL